MLSLLMRDLRDPALRIVLFAVIVAVAAVTAVNFFTSRIYQVIELQGAELIGGDLRLNSAQVIPHTFIEQAQALHLRTTHKLSFPSVILVNDDSVLTSVKAVSANYPLRGDLKVASRLDDSGMPLDEIISNDIPAIGSAWIEPRLAQQLKLNIGDTLILGKAQFKIARFLTYEPDRGGLFSQFAPRILINQADVARTELIIEGSRVSYSFAVASDDPAQIANYQATVSKQLTSDISLETPKEARPEMRSAIDRANRFLSLSALVAVILAGAAVAVAAWYFSRREMQNSAIMRCLGATQAIILRLYLKRLITVGALACSFGCLFGWIAQWGLTLLISHFLAIQLMPTALWSPLWIGFATGLLTLIGFALLPILQIRTVPPLRVLRADIPVKSLPPWQIIGLAVLAIGILLAQYVENLKLTLLFLAGTSITILIFLALAYVLVSGLQPLRHYSQFAWRFGLANLARRKGASSIQLSTFGLGIMALLLLTIVRLDILNAWQSSLPVGTPNHFVVNIASDELATFEQLLQQHKIHYSGLYPMAVGRFFKINGKEVKAEDYENPRAKGLINRTFNLSSTDTLPAANKITDGKFWQSEDGQLKARSELSVEQGFAETLGIRLNDTLTFSFGGKIIEGKVTSLRTVQWDSFNVNFFILATPDLTQELAKTYVTSLYLDAHTPLSTAKLLQQFPSIVVLDLRVLMKQVQTVMERAALAIQYVFLFTLLAGLMVLYAALTATQQERMYESALLRTLGATRSTIFKGLIAEFCTLGGLAGGLAAFAATLIAYLLSVQIFELPYTFNFTIWLVGIFCGAIGITIAGLIGTNKVLDTPPLWTIRQTA